jgi:hypothetical protein
MVPSLVRATIKMLLHNASILIRSGVKSIRKIMGQHQQKNILPTPGGMDFFLVFVPGSECRIAFTSFQATNPDWASVPGCVLKSTIFVG